MSNASRLVEKLRITGVVERQVCKNDRRAVDVKITRDGLALLTKLDEIEKEWQSAMQTVDIKDAEKLNIILDNLRG
jgi:DNA-binding MarR family transcriptional regulator